MRPSSSTRVRTTLVIFLPALAALAAPAVLGRSRTACRGGAPPRCCRETGGDDVRIGAATAQVARDRPRHVLPGRIGIRAQQGHQRHHLAGRAEAALVGIGIDERLLHRVQLTARREALDRLDRSARAGMHERHARVHGPTVDEHGARATGALVAHLLRAGEAAVRAQGIEERPVGRHAQLDRPPVDLERDVGGTRADERDGTRGTTGEHAHHRTEGAVPTYSAHIGGRNAGALDGRVVTMKTRDLA